MILNVETPETQVVSMTRFANIDGKMSIEVPMAGALLSESIRQRATGAVVKPRVQLGREGPGLDDALERSGIFVGSAIMRAAGNAQPSLLDVTYLCFCWEKPVRARSASLI